MFLVYMIKSESEIMSDFCETGTVIIYIINGLNPIDFEINLTISQEKVAVFIIHFNLFF